ncbi:MAG: ABC-type transport system, involved in lipoprotein release, permease component [Planctomycetota bacterium]|nr:ABC-type transport system, involved in lipoprotein release, permease component [Planctomycetota bacterium]
MSRSSTRMRASDLLSIAVSALAQQKVRTALTVLGVAVGTFALIVSISVGQGVDRAILDLFRGTNALRQVAVYVKYETVPGDVPEANKTVIGDMSESKRARLRHAMIRKWDRRSVARVKNRLDQEGLERLAKVPHVERLVPVVQHAGRGKVEGFSKDLEVNFSSADPDSDFNNRLIAGRSLTNDVCQEAIVHEFLLYELGMVADEDVRKAIGKSIRLEYRMGRGSNWSLTHLLTFGPKGFTAIESEALIRALHRLAILIKLLPIPGEERVAFLKLLERSPIETESMREDIFEETFTIVGVMREALPEDEKRNNLFFAGNSNGTDILLPPRTAAKFFLRSSVLAENGLNNAVLIVDRDENVKAVTKAVEASGFSQSSLVQVLETIRMNVLLISLATAFIAAVALTVAAIGITNTMIMSVLERIHEIGIMKALGARTSQIRVIFLVEGAFIGLLGGSLGLLLSWLASIPGDRFAKSIMEAQTPRPVAGSLFAFPLWLVLGGPALAALITMLASVYPASRAAKVDPITSLRHE